MRITLLRNATLVIESGDQRLLVDPMLCAPRRSPPLTLLRHRPRWNPLVPLPAGAPLRDLTGGLVTHFRRGHVDHLDGPGKWVLARAGVPVACQPGDARALRRKGIDAKPVEPWEPAAFAGGTVTAVPTSHGRGVIGRAMGPGYGYVLELPGEPMLYLSGDTVLTEDVRRAVEQHRPGIAVLHAGVARLDVGGPILMPPAEQEEFARLVPGTVVAVHLEAMGHCGQTRAEVRERLPSALVPDDGDAVEIL